MFQKTVLANSLTLLTSPVEGAASTTVMIMVKAGSRYESARINGLSHFLEHMAFKGTPKRPTAKAISTEIDAVGGEFNAFTSKDHTAYFIKAASKHTPLMLDILSDMLTNSLFKEEEIEREKGVIIEEINMYEDTPMRKVGEVFENLMFGETPMGRDIAGSVETVRALKREDFLNYVNSLYKTRNMVVSIAGGIQEMQNVNLKNQNDNLKFKINKNIREKYYVGATRESPHAPLKTGQGTGRDLSLQKMVEKYFAKIKDETTDVFAPFKQTQNSPRLRIVYKKTEQAHLVLGFPSISINDPRRYALSVLTTILGGGMSSRLFIEVRERRGLCYYIHASADSYHDCGAWTVSAGVDLKRIAEAINTILKELRKFEIRNSKFEITKKELSKAKEYLKGHLILSLEDSQAIAGLYASQFLLEDKVETPEEIMAQVDRVTLDDVYSVASDIFNHKKINLAVIGPFTDMNKFEKLVN